MCSGESLLGALVQDEGLQPPRRLAAQLQPGGQKRQILDGVQMLLGGGGQD